MNRCGRARTVPEAQASGYPDEALTGSFANFSRLPAVFVWVARGFEPRVKHDMRPDGDFFTSPLGAEDMRPGERLVLSALKGRQLGSPGQRPGFRRRMNEARTARVQQGKTWVRISW